MRLLLLAPLFSLPLLAQSPPKSTCDLPAYARNKIAPFNFCGAAGQPPKPQIAGPMTTPQVEVCSVPLTPVAAADTHDRMEHVASPADPKAVVPPPAPSCADKAK